MRLERAELVRLRRRAAGWTSAGLGALLLAAAFAPAIAEWAGEALGGVSGGALGGALEWAGVRGAEDWGAPARQLNYPDDPLINRPYGEAENRWLVFVHVILIMYMLVGINVVCDVYFAGALEIMWKKWDIKPDVAGATFMAAGGSAPELFTSFVGAVAETDVGFGTIVGSAVFNVLFVIGLCGFVSKTPIALTWWPLFRDCSYYIMGLSLLALFAKDWQVEIWEAILLFLFYVAYGCLMYFNERLEVFVTRLFRGGTRADSADAADAATAATAATSKASQVAPLSEGGGGPVGPGGAEGSAEGEANLREMALGEAPPGPPEHHIGRAQQPDCPCAELPLEAGDAERSVLAEGKGDFVPWLGELGGMDGTLGVKESVLVVKGGPEEEQRDPVEEGAARAPGAKGEAEGEGADGGEEAEEDPVEEMMQRPEGTREQITWFLCLPVYFPIYWLIPKPAANHNKFLATFFVSLVWIALLTYLLVWWIEITGEVFHIHYIIMSSTVLAAGTSIPDAASSIAVTRMGEGDMAVSSSIGSNIFDILVGLPVPWLFKIICIERNVSYKVTIGSPYLTFFVLLLLSMVFCVILCIHFLGWKLNRALGLFMSLLYAVFLAIVITVYTTEPAALRDF